MDNSLCDDEDESVWLRVKYLGEEYIIMMNLFSMYMFCSKLPKEEIVDTFGGKFVFVVVSVAETVAITWDIVSLP